MENWSVTYAAVEGIDGSGKTTLCRALAERHPGVVVPHSEPSAGLVGRRIRSWLRDDAAERDPLVTAALFFADRSLELRAALSSLEPGRLLLSDRCWVSTAAYQSRDRLEGEGDDGATLTLGEVVRMHEGLPRPHVLLYLDCPTEVCLERLRTRGRAADSLETERTLVLARSRYEEVLSAARGLGWRVARIDASAEPETVLAHARDFLGLRGR